MPLSTTAPDTLSIPPRNYWKLVVILKKSAFITRESGGFFTKIQANTHLKRSSAHMISRPQGKSCFTYTLIISGPRIFSGSSKFCYFSFYFLAYRILIWDFIKLKVFLMSLIVAKLAIQRAEDRTELWGLFLGKGILSPLSRAFKANWCLYGVIRIE